MLVAKTEFNHDKLGKAKQFTNKNISLISFISICCILPVVRNIIDTEMRLSSFMPVISFIKHRNYCWVVYLFNNALYHIDRVV